MTTRVLAASLFAAIAAGAAPTVQAADLYGEQYEPRAEAPYYEPDRGGYAEEYGAPPDYYGDEGPGEDRNDWRYAEPVPPRAAPGPGGPWEYGPRGSLKDGYLAPVPRPPRFVEGPPYAGRAPQCTSRWETLSRLQAQGWARFREIDRKGPLVIARAVRIGSGRPFILEIDRCTGQIVQYRANRGPALGYYAPRRGY